MVRRTRVGQALAAQGRFLTGLGWFGASWTVTEEGSSKTFTLEIDMPNGTRGTVTLPEVTVDSERTTMVDGPRLELEGGEHVVVLKI